MNLANKITIARVFMIPLFLVALFSGFFAPPLNRYIALGIFVVASLSDTLDGYIARSRNLITNFGKFMDPLADKLLVSAAFISLVGMGRLSAWVVIIIISREFIITGFRLIAAEAGVVIAASVWGKIKTITQMILIMVMLLNIDSLIASAIEGLLIFLATAFTVISGVDYVIKNKDVLKS
ncbi:MAG: CDP-diacylglycerol--glycerol-3-phosphate 3-phosphatidyltransferase [Lachnospiraceae bacterium]|nr:CDP-diacylglycerol--glycerol-3-phosphate 3-phosphatidyltransferase [Lachnospiraceae bacterium]